MNQHSTPHSKLQLQSIQFPDVSVCDIDELYFHKQDEEIRFDGYFNQFQIEKWKRYTNITQLFLSFQSCGYKALRLYHNQNCIQEISLLPSEHKTYEIAFPWDDYKDGVFWFSFMQEPLHSEPALSGFYTGTCAHPQHVTLALDICTFRRENELLRTLRLLHEKIFTNHLLQVSEQIQIYIVDNSQTLHEHSEFQQYFSDCHDPISIFENRNSGGAGGFTRGMLEIIKDKEKKKLSHVILMDDDALPNPDLFVRIYGFLRARKSEWQDITLGSSMLTEEKPHILFASGETWENCLPINQNRYLDLRDYSTTCRDTLLSTIHEHEYYSGWWCCCYSLSVVREDNLPIPLFIHHDDIEFGLRNTHYGITILNGVCVWHHDWSNVRSTNIMYYDIRNNFIEVTQRYANCYQALSLIWRFYWKPLAFRLLQNAPNDIYWSVRAATDFLKGPKWLWQQDPEALHHEIVHVPRTHLLQRWYQSAKSCICLLLFGPHAIRNYQKNLHRYTNADAWRTYLQLPTEPTLCTAQENA